MLAAFKLPLLIASAVCLIIALLIATGVISSSNQDDWFIGGVLAFVLSFVDFTVEVRK